MAGRSRSSTALPALQIGDIVIAHSVDVMYLGFLLVRTTSGRVVVSSRRPLAKLFATASAVIAIPRCPLPLLRTRLTATFALTHADYAWQLAHHLRPREKEQLCRAVCSVLRRVLGLHPRCSADLVCSSAGIVPPRYRMKQMRIGNGWTAQDARRAWAHDASEELLGRVGAIRSLLLQPDPYVKAMARHISWPSALRPD